MGSIKDCFPARYIMATMSFFGFILVYMLRTNMNLAIVAMVNYTALANNSKPTESSDQCGSYNASSIDPNDDGPFVWNESTQSLVTSAFFWGYLLSNLPGGRLAELFGSKWLFAGSQVLCGLVTLLMPVAAYGGEAALIATRALLGVAQGVSFPSMHVMLAKWAPPQERSRISTIVYAGSQIGTVIGLPLTGLIIDELGWEYVFYIQGIFPIVWVVFWIFFVYEDPEVHPRISEEEKEYIVNSLKTDEVKTKAIPVPWKAVFTSMPFYAVLVANLCNNWGFFILLTELPIYMKNMLHYDIKSNSLLSAFPYFVMWVFSLMFSPIADYINRKKWLSLTGIRKVFNVISHGGPAVCLIVVAFAGCDEVLTLAMLTLAVGLQGGIYSGWFSNHIDFAPNFAGTLFGITNGLSTIPSWVGPVTVGLITNGNQTIEAWQIVFFMTAGVLFFNVIFFTIFGSAVEQPWNRIDFGKTVLHNHSDANSDSDSEVGSKASENHGFKED